MSCWILHPRVASNLFSCTVHLFRRKELLEGVYGMGFNKPSKIQEVALPILVADPYVYAMSILVCE